MATNRTLISQLQCYAICALLLGLCPIGVNAQLVPSLIAPSSMTTSQLTSQQLEKYQKALNSGVYDTLQFVEVQNLADTENDGELPVEIQGDKCGEVVFKAKHVEYTSESKYYWYGELLEKDSCDCEEGWIIVISSDGQTYGLVEIGDESYDLIDLGGDVNVLGRFRDTAFDSYCQTGSSGDAPQDSLHRQSVSDRFNGNCEVDILVLYPDGAESEVADISQAIDKGFSKMREALRNSNILSCDLEINLAGTVKVDFVESQDIFDDVNTLIAGTTILALPPDGRNVTQLRADFAADLVLMLTSSNYVDVLGLVNAVGPVADSAFTILVANSISGSVSLPHEVAHLFACRHQRCG
jgi:hypothetical protein